MDNNELDKAIKKVEYAFTKSILEIALRENIITVTQLEKADKLNKLTIENEQ